MLRKFIIKTHPKLELNKKLIKKKKRKKLIKLKNSQNNPIFQMISAPKNQECCLLANQKIFQKIMARLSSILF